MEVIKHPGIEVLDSRAAYVTLKGLRRMENFRRNTRPLTLFDW